MAVKQNIPGLQARGLIGDIRAIDITTDCGALSRSPNHHCTTGQKQAASRSDRLALDDEVAKGGLGLPNTPAGRVRTLRSRTMIDSDIHRH